MALMTASTGAREVSARPLPLFFGREDLQDALGDVESRASIHRFLQDEVEFLRLRDLLDHAVRALEKGLQLLVAAQVQVFAVLALQPLEIDADALQLAFLRAPVAF